MRSGPAAVLPEKTTKNDPTMMTSNGVLRTPPSGDQSADYKRAGIPAEILLPGSVSNRLMDFGALHFWAGGGFHIWQPLDLHVPAC